jgi:hypothetical protein
MLLLSQGHNMHLTDSIELQLCKKSLAELYDVLKSIDTKLESNEIEDLIDLTKSTHELQRSTEDTCRILRMVSKIAKRETHSPKSE